MTFSLCPHHIDAIRQASYRRQVSQSEVVRQLLDLALKKAQPDVERKTRRRNAGGWASPSMGPLIKELVAIRRELARMRDAIARLETGQSDGGGRTEEPATNQTGPVQPN